MKSLRDPEGVEVKNLLRAVSFIGKQVLEIGCGSGWLTWQYADAAEKVVGIDPCLEDIKTGLIDRPSKVSHVSITQCTGERLPFSAGIFDIALFSNSL
jgi:ubiquinone/menaquinone biosynthesis C-methylase UbiE